MSGEDMSCRLDDSYGAAAATRFTGQNPAEILRKVRSSDLLLGYVGSVITHIWLVNLPLQQLRLPSGAALNTVSIVKR